MHWKTFMRILDYEPNMWKSLGAQCPLPRTRIERISGAISKKDLTPSVRRGVLTVYNNKKFGSLYTTVFTDAIIVSVVEIFTGIDIRTRAFVYENDKWKPVSINSIQERFMMHIFAKRLTA